MQGQRNRKRILSILMGILIGVIGCQRTATAAPVSAAAAQGDEQVLLEKGRQAFGQACVACHNVGTLQPQRKSAEKWRDTVYSMISRGAHILPEEIEPLTAYLTKNYGPNSPPPSLPAQTSGGTRSAAGTLEQQLPEAEGKSIVLRNCQQCHGLETILGKTGTSDDWSTIINRMVDYGAKLTQAEQEKVTGYLRGLPQSREKR